MESGRDVTIQTSSNKWLTSSLTTYRGSIGAVREFIPKFERRTFGPKLLPVEGDDSQFSASLPAGTPGYNLFYDTIVRQPINSDEIEVPVGIVSKQYTLVQHTTLFDEAVKAIKKVEIKPDDVKADLDLTVYGERMRLGLLFPERYNLKLDNDDEMGLRLECFNSVDGSMKFMAVIGWLRFVCANGMVIGVADSYYRRRHNRYMELKDISAILKEGISTTTKEKEVYLRWMKRKVSEEKLAKWTNGHLANKWGVKAATRTWHITTSGRDVTFADPFEKGKPTQKTVIFGKRVPGAILPGDTVFAVSQALSWLAKERRDVQEQLEWKQQIPDLVKPLVGR